MTLNADQCYRSIITRDSRFDGRFFVAVRTTRIYCRPVCRVKPPLRKNCTFYIRAAEAEAAGYRPCKMCRPELAPGTSRMDISSQLVRSTSSYINQDFLVDHSLEELAVKLGITARQMRRVFRQEFGVSPIEYWQTQRLLLAKQLLTDSRLPVSPIAMASGFQSLRRFNFALKKRYRMTPSKLRKRQREHALEDSPEFSFRLGYRPPFDWEQLLRFLTPRAIPQVESVADRAYFRTVQISRYGRQHQGYLEVRNDTAKRMLTVRLSDTRAPVCVVVLERVRRLFDLEADSLAINSEIGPLANAHPGLRVPGSFDGFEMSVRAILGQQISVSSARTLAGRLAICFGTALTLPAKSLSYLFPSAARMAEAAVEDIIQTGVTRRRAEAIHALARMINKGELHLEPGNRIEGTLRQLRKIPGVGEWTVQYLAMRALSWPDAFPHTDLGIRKALGEDDPQKILQMAEKWRPWRAYAAFNLWNHPERHS